MAPFSIGYPDIQKRATSRECALVPGAFSNWLNWIDGPRDPGVLATVGQDINLVFKNFSGAMECDYFAIIEAKRMASSYIEMRVRGWNTAPELPSTVTGLVGWYDADDDSTINQTAGLVNQWNDKSGAGNHATQSGGARPAVLGRTATGNFRGGIEFDGIDDWLSVNGLAAGFSGTNIPYTIFVVSQQQTQAALNELFCVSNSGSNRPLRNLFKLTGNILRSSEGSNAGSSASVSASPVGLLNFDITAVRGQGTSSQLFLNGAQVGTNTTSLGATTINQAVIGARRILTNMSSFWDGIISEVLVYNAALSDADIAKVNNYLAVKHRQTVFYDIDLSAVTPVGSFAKDKIFTRETPTSFSNYEIDIPYTSAAGKYPSKLFLGKFLDVDSDPEVQIELVDNTQADIEGAGNVYMGGQFVDLYQVTVTYYGLTAIELGEVRAKIILQPKNAGFVLYNPTNTKLLHNTKLIYARLEDHSIKCEYQDYFTVVLKFKEFTPV